MAMDHRIGESPCGGRMMIPHERCWDTVDPALQWFSLTPEELLLRAPEEQQQSFKRISAHESCEDRIDRVLQWLSLAPEQSLREAYEEPLLRAPEERGEMCEELQQSLDHASDQMRVEQQQLSGKVLRDESSANNDPQGLVTEHNYLHKLWLQSSSSANSDLKPENILLDPNMEYKITDLALSRLSDRGDGAHTSIVRADGFLPREDAYVKNLMLICCFIGCLTIKIGSHTKHAPKYLSVHHLLIQMVLFAYKSSEGISSYVKSIMPKSIFDMAKRLCSFASPNVSQHHSDPVSCKAERGITKAMGAKTSDPWIVATGSPHHATGNCALLSGSITEHGGLFVHAVDRAPMQVRGCGALVTAAVVLPDVWVVPGLTANLVSVRQLNELGYIVGFGGGACYISSAADGTIIGKATLGEGGLYVLDFLKVPLGM